MQDTGIDPWFLEQHLQQIHPRRRARLGREKSRGATQPRQPRAIAALTGSEAPAEVAGLDLHEHPLVSVATDEVDLGERRPESPEHHEKTGPAQRHRGQSFTGEAAFSVERRSEREEKARDGASQQAAHRSGNARQSFLSAFDSSGESTL